MFAILRNRDYLNLWLGQTVSLVGDGIRNWAMIYWVFKTSGQSSVLQAAMMVAAIAPIVFLAPIAGVLVDRWDRRRTMIISDIIRGCLMLLMLLTVSAGQVWATVGLVFLGSCTAQFFEPSRGAMIPRVVGKEKLLAASSLGQMTRTLIQLAEPAIGTGLFLLVGPMVAVAIDAATFFLSAIFIARVSVSGKVEQEAGHKPAFLPEFRAGLRYCWESVPIRALIIGFSVLMMGVGSVNTLGIFVLRDLGLPETAMSIMATSLTLATLVVSILVGSVARKLKRIALLVPGGMVGAVLGVGAISQATNLYWVIAGGVFMGLGMGLLNIGVAVLVQSIVPDQMRGRVYGTVNPLPMGAMLLSVSAAGYLARQMPAQTVIGFAGWICLAAVLVTFMALRNVTLPGAAPAKPASAAGDD